MLVAAAAGAVLAGTSPAPAGDRTGGVVAGLTGEAAERAAGPAAEHFRELAAERSHRVSTADSAKLAAESYLHTAWGTLFWQPNGKGIRATHSVFTGADAVTHGGDVVYAPTALAPGGACMEMTTAYTSGGPVLWAWDWCGGNAGIGKLVTIDAGFLATYTTTVNGYAAYRTDVHQTDAASNTWSAYLYNYQTQAWDTFYTSSGTYDLDDPEFGWDIFEIYSTRDPATNQAWYCASMAGRKFEASDIEVNINGTWQAATTANTYPMGNLPSGSEFDCPALTFSVTKPNDHWVAQIG
jgi:hypothetical protein